ncbi:MAG: AAA family ATPase [Chlorobiaceae bacterium]
MNKQHKIELKGKVITFYSYKGGVGRTMALVNIACLMATQKKKILLIDWDLEAPGLHSFFNNAINKEQVGFVDFITEVIEKSTPEVINDNKNCFEYLSKHLNKYIQSNIQIEESEFQLDLIKAGKFDNDYIVKLNAINWLEFYKNSPAFFRNFAQYLESYYDYILIDSRTGLSDTGGICTMLMPQILVLVFALNNQNINGVFDVAKQSINYRFNSSDFRDLTVLPLPSRIDDQNSAELAEWMKRYTKRFEALFTEIYMLDECSLTNYFNIAKIPYKPIHAYGEKITVLSESISNDFFISYHYAQFYNLIVHDTPIYEILSREEIEIKEINTKTANFHFQRGLDFFFVNNFELSELEFEETCKLDPTNHEAFYYLGTSLGNLAKTKKGKKAEALYHQAFEKYQKSIEIKQDQYKVFNNWGALLGDLAKNKKGKEAEALYHQAFERYQKAKAKLNTNEDIPVEYVHNTVHRLKNEVFAVELLKNPIYIEKDNDGLIDITINRNNVRKAVITTQAKKSICNKYITNKEVITQKDNEYHKFLTNKSCNEKLEINLDEFPLRWASGGVLSVVNYQDEKQLWTPFFFRDIEPVGWNISLGASERHFNEEGKVVTNLNAELNDPLRFILREFIEETLVLTKKPKAGARNPSTAKKFCFPIGELKKYRKNALKFADDHINCRANYDNLVINIGPLKAGNNSNPDFDIDVDFLETNTTLNIIHSGQQYKIRHILVCLNLLELGIEVVKVAKYTINDDDYLLDGEILNHNDGTQELVRMPFALISHRYLEKEFGMEYKPNHTLDIVQSSIIGSPIPPEDIRIFNWDIEKRLEVLNGRQLGIGKEKERYEHWKNRFHLNFLDDEGNLTSKNPSSLFTPASVKIIHSYFSNVKKI